MKNIFTIATLAVCFLPAQVMASIPETSASWAEWDGTSGGFVQNGHVIEVTYTGQTDGTIINSGFIFNAVPSSFTSSSVTNTPGDNGTIKITGGNDSFGHFHFSQAVINPIIALWSVGRDGSPVSFVFDSANFEILSQGAGNWGGGSLIKSGATVTGYEGNGLVQFIGSYTDINFSLPDYENYYGATVGALMQEIVSVPLPSAFWLLGSGLMGLVAMGRRPAQ